VDRLLAAKSEGVGLIVRAISFQDFQCDHNPPTSQTDRQTDGRHAIARPQCAVKMGKLSDSACSIISRLVVGVLCRKMA